MIIQLHAPIPDWPGLAGRDIAFADADNLHTTPTRRIFDWWQGAAQHGLPRRADFDILAFTDIAAHLYLIHAVADGYELRLAGEEYILLFGLKKGWIWRSDSPDPVMRDSANLLTFVTRVERPMRTIGYLELSERQLLRLEALICPLAADDGTASQILGCAVAIDDD